MEKGLNKEVIMKDILRKAGEMITKNLLDYAIDIEKAYLMAEDKFKVSLGATFSPEGSGTKVMTEINFTPEKIKDKSEAIVNSEGKQVQRELKFTPADKPITKFYGDKVKGHTAGARIRARGYVHR